MGEEVALVAPMLEDEEPGENEGVLTEIDASVGDRKIKWKRGDTGSIAKAKAKFEELRAKGHAFFVVRRVRVTKFPDSGDISTVVATKTPKGLVEEGQVTKFEPDADEIVAVPRRTGG